MVSASTRPRSWWWISGDRPENTHPSPSTRHLWSGWPALSSSAFTSPRISHGLLTQMQCWRRHISVSSSWDGWGSLERAPESSDPSTPALWRASWPAASPPGFGNSTAGNRRALQRVVRTARHIVGGELPSLQDIYTRRCTRKARRIIKDSSHPSHSLLSLLPSWRRLRSIRSCTSRLRDSFFPQAIRLMSNQKYYTLQHTPTLRYAMHCTLTQFNWTTHTLHKHNNLSATTGYHPMHSHDIAYPVYV